MSWTNITSNRIPELNDYVTVNCTALHKLFAILQANKTFQDDSAFWIFLSVLLLCMGLLILGTFWLQQSYIRPNPSPSPSPRLQHRAHNGHAVELV